MKDNKKYVLATVMFVLLSTVVVKGYDRNFTETDEKLGLKVNLCRSIETININTDYCKYSADNIDYTENCIEDTDCVENTVNAASEDDTVCDRLTSVNAEVDAVLQKNEAVMLSDFKCLNQNSLGLPTGCEITSLTMALNYAGYNADVYDLADNYLDKGENRASDPYQVFVGNPRDNGSFGCYAPVIVNCASRYGADVSNISYCDFSTLLSYVEDGNPVCVWGTADMVPTAFGRSSWTCDDGTYISWRGNEHCMVLVGFDTNKGEVYIADPLKGYIVSYNMDVFYTRWVEQDRQAVVIY